MLDSLLKTTAPTKERVRGKKIGAEAQDKIRDKIAEIMIEKNAALTAYQLIPLLDAKGVKIPSLKQDPFAKAKYVLNLLKRGGRFEQKGFRDRAWTWWPRGVQMK